MLKHDMAKKDRFAPLVVIGTPRSRKAAKLCGDIIKTVRMIRNATDHGRVAPLDLCQRVMADVVKLHLL